MDPDTDDLTQNTDKSAAGGDQTPKPTDTFTQDDVQRVIAERLKRERAKYADYDDLKKAAAKLQAIEDADKTAQQKAAEEVAAAKAEAEAAKADVVRFRVAAEHGITGADIDLIGAGAEEDVTGRAKRIGGLLAAERELADLKKAQADAAKQPPQQRPAAREWQPGATPVSVNGGPTAKDRAAAQARALGWVQSNNS